MAGSPWHSSDTQEKDPGRFYSLAIAWGCRGGVRKAKAWLELVWCGIWRTPRTPAPADTIRKAEENTVPVLSGRGDLVTKDMAEVLNAFLSWLSLAELAAGPPGPPESVKAKCYRGGLSTGDLKWCGPGGMCLMVQKDLADVSAVPIPAVIDRLWQWAPCS